MECRQRLIRGNKVIFHDQNDKRVSHNPGTLEVRELKEDEKSTSTN